MPWGLERFQDSGDLHFVTFSCYDRRPYLGSAESRNVFLDSLESVRLRYGCSLHGYVVMPEHVPLVVERACGYSFGDCDSGFEVVCVEATGGAAFLDDAVLRLQRFHR
jgi:hypothetical protein